MSFAAVICASHAASESPSGGASVPLRAVLHFAGNSLVEYQARQAAEAGATRVMILVGAVTQLLSRAIDRLTADGINVTLVRDMVTLVRDAPRDMDMLLVGDGAIVAQSHYASLAGHGGNAILVAGDTRATADFERIDAGQRWAGLLRVTPDILFGTLDMLGDWDLELTLLRAAVQAGAARAVVPQEDVLEGRVALVDSQNAADLVVQALLGHRADLLSSGGQAQGGIEYYLLARPASWLAPTLLRGQVPASQVRLAGTGLAAVGTVAILLGWPGVGLILMLAALTLSLGADRLAQLARREGQDGWLALAPAAMVLVGIALLGGEAGAQLDGLYLALLLAILLLSTKGRHTSHAPGWAMFTPGTAALLLLLAVLLGHTAPGMAIATLCAIGSLGYAILAHKRPEN